MALGISTPELKPRIETSSGADVFVVKTTQDRGAILGRMFIDSNKDGIFDVNELPLAGRTVYLDQNRNGMLDAGELRRQQVPPETTSFSICWPTRPTTSPNNCHPAGKKRLPLRR